MLEYLKQKLLSWTPTDSSAFYGNTVRYGNSTGKIWEKTDTGTYLYSATGATYYDLNGTTYDLEYGDLVSQYQYCQQVSDYCAANGLTKIERPQTVELVSIYGIPYTYTVKVNPFPLRGIPLTNAVCGDHSVARENSINASKAYLIGARDIITAVDAIEGNQTSSKYPRDIKIVKLNLNPNTGEWFWSGDIRFSATRGPLVTAIANYAANYSDIQMQVMGLSPGISTELKEFVRTECTIFQLP